MGAPARSTARRSTGFSSARARSASNIAPPEPIVKGRHLLELGVEPGPRMGEILRRLYEQQLDGHVQTLDEGLALARAIVADVTEYGKVQLEMNRAGSAVLLVAAAMATLAPGAAAQEPEREPIGRFAVDARVALPALSRRSGDRHRARRDGGEPPEPRARPGGGRPLLPGAHGQSRARHRRRVAGSAGGSKTLDPTRRAERRGPTVKTQLLGAVAAGVAELRRPGRMELHQRRHRLGEVHDRARGRRRSRTPSGRTRAINYGGGARWFAKEHLAFTFDLRFYRINPQDAATGRPAYGGRRMMVFSAGISLK